VTIHGPPWGREAAKTERAAIQGWGPTLRLIMIRAAATTPIGVLLYYVHQIVH